MPRTQAKHGPDRLDGRVAAGALLCCLFLGACGAVPSRAAPSAVAAASADWATADAASFHTRFFDPPLDFTVPFYVKAVPDEESARFLTFTASDGSRAIRILRPVSVYPPGASTPAAVPDDYPAYLNSLAVSGAQLTDRGETTIDGHDVTLMTAFSSESLEGSIGCQRANLPAIDCFGVGDAVVLRIAMMRTDAGPLLIWLRTLASNNPDMQQEAQRFDDFLTGVHFADRPPQPGPTPTGTKFDGAYTWTLTVADAVARLPALTTDERATYPWTVSATLRAGEVKLHVEKANRGSIDETGTFDASDDRLTFHFAGVAQVYAVAQDDAGSLRLTAIDARDAEDALINTAEPWMKVP